METAHCQALTEIQSQVERFCAGIWHDPANGSLLVMHSHTGTGKTRLARAVFTWLQSVRGARQYVPRPGYVSGISPFWCYWPQWFDNARNLHDWALGPLIDATVLFLDDIGHENDSRGQSAEKLGQVLSRRERKWTVITTNFGPDDWPTAFDARVADRLFRNSTIIDMTAVPSFSKVGAAG